jgi:iron complex outermembrane receptor protein
MATSRRRRAAGRVRKRRAGAGRGKRLGRARHGAGGPRPNGKLDLWYKHSQDDHVATGGYVFDNCNLQDNGYCTTDAAGLSNGTGGVINGITGEKASPYQNFSNVPGFLDRKIDVYQGKLAYDLGGIKLTSITNYTKLTKSYLEDGDATPLDLIRYETQARYSQFSEELRLSGDLPRFRWQAGFYYLDMKINGHTVTTGNPALGAAVAVGLAAATLDRRDLSPDLEELVAVRADRIRPDRCADADHRSALFQGHQGRYLSFARQFGRQHGGAGVEPELRCGDPRRRSHLQGRLGGARHAELQGGREHLLFASWNRGIKGGNFTLSPRSMPRPSSTRRKRSTRSRAASSGPTTARPSAPTPRCSTTATKTIRPSP